MWGQFIPFFSLEGLQSFYWFRLEEVIHFLHAIVNDNQFLYYSQTKNRKRQSGAGLLCDGSLDVWHHFIVVRLTSHGAEQGSGVRPKHWSIYGGCLWRYSVKSWLLLLRWCIHYWSPSWSCLCVYWAGHAIIRRLYWQYWQTCCEGKCKRQQGIIKQCVDPRAVDATGALQLWGLYVGSLC